MPPDKLLCAKSKMCRTGKPHSCSGMFPVNMLARSPKYDTLMSFSAIGRMVPKNPFSPRSSDNKRVQSWKDADRSPERLLLLSLKQTSEGSEHIELGMPPDSLYFD